MNIAKEQVGDVVVVESLMEDLDAGNAKAFKNVIAPLLEENSKVILDMNRVKFVDSSGCGTLISCLRVMNGKGGEFKLCSVQKPVQTLFELIRIHKIIDICNTREESLTAFQASDPRDRGKGIHF